MTVTVKSEDDEPVNVSVAEELEAIKKAFQKQEDFNKILLEELKSHKTYIDESLEKRDKTLMQSIRSLQEQKQAIAETAPPRSQAFSRGYSDRNERFCEALLLLASYRLVVLCIEGNP
jgi:hypothetical protein